MDPDARTGDGAQGQFIWVKTEYLASHLMIIY
jgi:hypothetical protein